MHLYFSLTIKQSTNWKSDRFLLWLTITVNVPLLDAFVTALVQPTKVLLIDLLAKFDQVLVVPDRGCHPVVRQWRSENAEEVTVD